ncbi:RNA repair transcriptional activator RtcR [Oceanobacter mangrovi]|uniref:RNA repair transcriptional activator RtcR n=1 Tax=Oceanobacter mangrovi TaxID=2862510 RepID=UPI001C8DAE21|nr:RNA repair transcriptional activator RtcR [Oceanobacter mangrovi]
MKKTIVLSFLGTQLDFSGKRNDRWARWRPNISLCSQPHLQIDELYLLHDSDYERLAGRISADIESVSPETRVIPQQINFRDPWDFEEVYAGLFDWCQNHTFDTDNNDYLFHITTGTHVAQICGFLLTESRHFPGKLIQSSPDSSNPVKSIGRVQTIDLDLSRYDQLASRFETEHQQGSDFLKQGINTANPRFNRMIAEIEKVAIRSAEPILLTGPTGAGKSQLASRIYQLKKIRGQVKGELVSVNCATLHGDNAMAALFGHTRGAFTGAHSSREGFLKRADRGILFLDEIGELGQEEQAMLLHALEHKSFYPVGSDQPQHSDFQLIAGTNRNLLQRIGEGLFREDLLARINLWNWQLPALNERPEDIPANLNFELEQYSQKNGRRVLFNKEARDQFLSFAQSPQSLWRGNFRDLRAAVTRLCTLAESARITTFDVQLEIDRLQRSWNGAKDSGQDHAAQQTGEILGQYLDQQAIQQIDQFDQLQLAAVLKICQQSGSLAAAGRKLFDVSRQHKNSSNDSSRLQKYLAKFSLKWSDLQRS